MTVENFPAPKSDPADAIRRLDYAAWWRTEHPAEQPPDPDTVNTTVELLLKAAPRMAPRHDGGYLKTGELTHLVNMIAARAAEHGTPPTPTDSEIEQLNGRKTHGR